MKARAVAIQRLPEILGQASDLCMTTGLFLSQHLCGQF